MEGDRQSIGVGRMLIKIFIYILTYFGLSVPLPPLPLASAQMQSMTPLSLTPNRTSSVKVGQAPRTPFSRVCTALHFFSL